MRALLLLSLLLLFLLTVPAEYLGDLSENKLNPDSIFTDLGAYGALSPTSPRNSIGLYGSAVSPYSATGAGGEGDCPIINDLSNPPRAALLIPFHSPSETVLLSLYIKRL